LDRLNILPSVESIFCNFILTLYIAHLPQHSHNSKFVIFQEKLWKVLKCYNFCECNDDSTALQRTVGYLGDLSGQKSIFEKSTEVEHKVTWQRRTMPEQKSALTEPLRAATPPCG